MGDKSFNSKLRASIYLDKLVIIHLMLQSERIRKNTKFKI